MIARGRMKTGRLLKFERSGASVQAYFYREAGRLHASVFVLQPGSPASSEPFARFSGETDVELERVVREFVDQRFPRRA